MNAKLKRSIAIFLLAIASFFSLKNYFVNAAEFSDVIKAVTITDTNGAPITEVAQYESFRFNADFELPNGAIKAGDQTVIKLPDSLVLTSGTSFEVKDALGNVVANATVDATRKQIVLVYTDYPSQRSDIKGSIFFDVRVDTTTVTEPKTLNVTLDVSGKPVTPNVSDINYIGPVGPSTDYIEKAGWKTNDPTVLGYAIAINRNGKDFTDLVISDELQNKAVRILPSSFRIQFVDWIYDGNTWSYTNTKDVTANYNVTFTDIGFNVDLGNIPATQGVRISYQVKADYVPSSGEIFINKVNLTSQEVPNRDITKSTRYTGAGGRAEGYVFGINIKKVNPSNEPLANAEFQVIRVSTNEVIDTIVSNENGIALVDGLLRDRYILRENSAPSGYQVGSDVIVEANEFSVENPILNKTIVNHPIVETTTETTTTTVTETTTVPTETTTTTVTETTTVPTETTTTTVTETTTVPTETTTTTVTETTTVPTETTTTTVTETTTVPTETTTTGTTKLVETTQIKSTTVSTTKPKKQLPKTGSQFNSLLGLLFILVGLVIIKFKKFDTR